MLLNEMESLKASKELGDFAISAAPGEAPTRAPTGCPPPRRASASR